MSDSLFGAARMKAASKRGPSRYGKGETFSSKAERERKGPSAYSKMIAAMPHPSQLKRDETYEGWSNHATWLVALTFDNDEPLYRKRLAASGGKGFTSASVKAFVKRTRPGVYRKVNWKELAEHWSHDF
jgi:hypothetical protein